MRVERQVFVSSLVAMFFAVVIIFAKDWPIEARMFPWVIGIPMLILGLVQIALDLRGVGKTVGVSDPEDDSTPSSATMAPELLRSRTLNIFCWIYGLLGLIWLVGFQVAVPVVVFCYLKIQSREGWIVSLGLTTVAWAFLWGIFDHFLHLPFPQGMVFQWLERLYG